MRQICRIAVFPVALVVAVASAMAAMDRGVDPVAAMFSVYLAGMVVVTALPAQFLSPFRWRRIEEASEAVR